MNRFEQWNALIAPQDAAAMARAKAHWDGIAKPLNGLGKLETAVERIAGVTGDEIQKAVEEFFAEHGFPVDLRRPGREKGLIHGVGHGVGLDIHEEPRISHGAGALESGQVVTVEPGLYDPAVGGVRIEDTVLVTPEGPRFFARLGRRLRVK